MKTTINILLAVICLIFQATTIFGQDSRTRITGMIEPFNVGISYDKTTNLIFPYSIKSVDRGSADVLVQKAAGIENVLQVKAAVEDFQPTNLTIITAEGALYSFSLRYQPNPAFINLKVADLAIPSIPIVQFSPDIEYESQLKEIAQRIGNRQSFLSKINDDKNDMMIALDGIYIKDDQLYFQFSLENNSQINYDIDGFRLYIRDAKRSKRTASQEVELQPTYTYGNLKRIEGKSKQTIVLAIKKFTIPDKKYLKIEIQELNGGRQLELKISNKTLLKARTM
ncbi:conjugative transposon protein TraN [Sphingobacterium sp. UGAL515B_05]|uniref:conjugative transposon protein TraN n=1 Tax=Sphingobacterium sp. UGAL515B_05 TaxID=2986767 RepID=UPI002954562C|nr:conjugative transposon protein TraN [Sphingobacterium sp. UGAL515B_05]WON93756.1 conjugative transposon protein TraN [Sphingobacterium sp. UGAL515B_05]